MRGQKRANWIVGTNAAFAQSRIYKRRPYWNAILECNKYMKLSAAAHGARCRRAAWALELGSALAGARLAYCFRAKRATIPDRIHGLGDVELKACAQRAGAIVAVTHIGCENREE